VTVKSSSFCVFSAQFFKFYQKPYLATKNYLAFGSKYNRIISLLEEFILRPFLYELCRFRPFAGCLDFLATGLDLTENPT
jgi:hypothetical protein